MTSSLTPQEEIQRLNSIISVLLEQVATLKHENDMLRTGNGIENKNYTSDKIGNIINNPNYDYPENIGGTNSPNYDHPENIGGLNNSNYDYPENIGGINNSNRDHPDNIGGTNNKKYDYPEKIGGINNSNYAYPGNISGINSPNHNYRDNIGGINNKNQALPHSAHIVPANNLASPATGNATPQQNADVPKITPAVIEANTTNINMLAAVVRRSLHTRVPGGTCKSVAGELLFIHNNGTATGHELRRAAGLSKPGFAKHLPMIKRRNLIFKKGVKKYALTDMSIYFINKVFGKA